MNFSQYCRWLTREKDKADIAKRREEFVAAKAEFDAKPNTCPYCTKPEFSCFYNQGCIGCISRMGDK